MYASCVHINFLKVKTPVWKAFRLRDRRTFRASQKPSFCSLPVNSLLTSPTNRYADFLYGRLASAIFTLHMNNDSECRIFFHSVCAIHPCCCQQQCVYSHCCVVFHFSATPTECSHGFPVLLG